MVAVIHRLTTMRLPPQIKNQLRQSATVPGSRQSFSHARIKLNYLLRKGLWAQNAPLWYLLIAVDVPKVPCKMIENLFLFFVCLSVCVCLSENDHRAYACASSYYKNQTSCCCSCGCSTMRVVLLLFFHRFQASSPASSIIIIVSSGERGL